jgi:hypothetical protein
MYLAKFRNARITLESKSKIQKFKIFQVSRVCQFLFRNFQRFAPGRSELVIQEWVSTISAIPNFEGNKNSILKIRSWALRTCFAHQAKFRFTSFSLFKDSLLGAHDSVQWKGRMQLFRARVNGGTNFAALTVSELEYQNFNDTIVWTLLQLFGEKKINFSFFMLV